MSKLSHLKHINFNKYSIDSISYENYNLKNPNVKKKEYELSDDKIKLPFTNRYKNS